MASDFGLTFGGNQTEPCASDSPQHLCFPEFGIHRPGHHVDIAIALKHLFVQKYQVFIISECVHISSNMAFLRRKRSKLSRASLKTRASLSEKRLLLSLEPMQQ
jgi:hypothetical protein